MREVINIPDTELELHDNFQCFFKKLRFEIDRHMMNGTNLVCGPCELTTLDMLLEVFKNATIIPKGCGDLIDRAAECDCCSLEEGCFYNRADVIVKADEKGTE